MALIVAPQQRLDIQQFTDGSSSTGYTATAAQIFQAAYGEKLTQSQNILVQQVCRLVQRLAFGTVIGTTTSQDAYTQAGSSGVYQADLSLRVVLQQLLGCQISRLEGTADTGGQTYIENVLSCLQQRAEVVLKYLCIDQRGANHLALPHLIIIFLAIKGLDVTAVIHRYILYKIGAG